MNIHILVTFVEENSYVRMKLLKCHATVNDIRKIMAVEIINIVENIQELS
jgi:hypothetical protein